jgi:hypothetical protein
MAVPVGQYQADRECRRRHNFVMFPMFIIYRRRRTLKTAGGQFRMIYDVSVSPTEFFAG